MGSVNWPSFIWGLVLGGLAALLTGFLKKAGEDAWVALKARLFPAEPDPIAVPNDFNPNQYEQANFSWVHENAVHEKQAQGYTYFIHPTHHAKCFRQLPDRKEFVMRQPH